MHLQFQKFLYFILFRIERKEGKLDLELAHTSKIKAEVESQHPDIWICTVKWTMHYI
jgi:hypothetical protein